MSDANRASGRLDRMDDDALLEAFRSGGIGAGELTHRVHVRLAFLYLERHALGAAIDRFREDLETFARAQGESDLYHQTVTLAYLLLIEERRARLPESPTDGRDETRWRRFELAFPELLVHRGGVVERLYGAEILDDPHARRAFVFP